MTLLNKILLSLVLILAFIVQGTGLYFLTQQNIEYALGLHVISACLFPLPLWKLMPLRFRDQSLIMVLLFLICLLVPFVSGLGLLLCVTWNAYYSKPSIEEITESVEPETLPDNILKNLQLSQYNSSSLLAILDTSDSEDNRMKAVLKTRQMSDQESIPILKMALLDPVDEVRLLAYSMLDRKEKSIDSMIHKFLLRLKNKAEKQQSALHFKLAECYWELSYLGLAQGKAQTHILHSAYRHIQQFLKENHDDAEAYFLQARITLVLEIFQVTENSLIQALRCGMNTSRVAPYQAELAFATHRFDKIGHYVAAVDKTAKNNKLISEMLEQWT